MSVGLARAGFSVTGVDIKRQPNYPFEFIQMDFRRLTYEKLLNYDYLHFSPPCQAYSRGSYWARKAGKVYPDLFPAARRYAVASGKPYTIENVVGSPAKGLRLYGDMFGLPILRERIFENNMHLVTHLDRTSRNEHRGVITVAGKCPSINTWQWAMGIDWAASHEIKEAVPPVYGEEIGRLVLMFLATGGAFSASACLI
jgi:DNA (cytosine-5)-methyltransferase 1